MRRHSSLFRPVSGALLAPQSWMTDFPQVRGAKLLDLTLPGSHDSGAFTFTNRVLDQYQTDGIKKVYAAAQLLKKMGNLFGLVTAFVLEQTVENWGRAQARDFQKQLEAGIRWLDLRVMMLDGTPYFYHGFACWPVSEALTQFAQFAQAQPGEIVTLSFSHMTTLTADDQVALANSLVSTLGQSALCLGADYTNKTVGELSKQGTRFVVFNDSDQAPRSQFPFLLTERTFYFDPTASAADGINSVETLVDKLQAGLTPAPSRPAKIGFSITPSTSDIAWSIVNMLTPLTATHDLEWFTRDVRTALPNWLSNLDPTVKVGVVSTDFVNEMDLLGSCLARTGIPVPTRPTQIVQAGGAVNISSGGDFWWNTPGPQAMFIGNDGHVWQNWWTGQAWQWDDLGGLTNERTIVTALGSVTDPVNNAPQFLLVVASDGHLWHLASHRGSVIPPSATWADWGMPAPGVTIVKAMGLTYSRGPFAYVLGSDGNLYIYQGVDDVPGWGSVDTPPGVAIDSAFGCVTLGGFTNDSAPCCFVRGSDGNLWRNLWNGGNFEWDPLGQPTADVAISASLGATTNLGRDNDVAYCFCQGSDGAVWYYSSANGWNQQSLDGLAGISQGMGAITLGTDRPYLYVLDNVGSLWVMQFNNGSFAWQPLGTPPNAGVSITMPLGTLATADNRPYCYMLGSDGQVWQNFWSGDFVWNLLGDSTTLTAGTARGDKRSVRRNKKGQFKTEVDVGRSLAADRHRTSKTRDARGPDHRGDAKG